MAESQQASWNDAVRDEGHTNYHVFVILYPTLLATTLESPKRSLSSLEGLINPPVAVYSTTKPELSVHNLSAHEDYLVQIRAQNAYGAGPLSSPIRLWRPQDQGVNSTPLSTTTLPSVATNLSLSTLPLETKFKVTVKTLGLPHPIPEYHSTFFEDHRQLSVLMKSGLGLSVGFVLCLILTLVVIVTILFRRKSKSRRPCFRFFAAGWKEVCENSRTHFPASSWIRSANIRGNRKPAWSNLPHITLDNNIQIVKQMAENNLGPIYLGILNTRDFLNRPTLEDNCSTNNLPARAAGFPADTTSIFAGPNRDWEKSELTFTNNLSIGFSMTPDDLPDRSMQMVQVQGFSSILRDVRSGNTRAAIKKKYKHLSESISFLLKLTHPNVVRTFGIWSGCSSKMSLPSLVSEWPNQGPLDEYLIKLLKSKEETSKSMNHCQLHHRCTPLRMSLVIGMLMDIISGLEYLFGQGYAYGNFSSSLVLLNDQLRCKLQVVVCSEPLQMHSSKSNRTTFVLSNFKHYDVSEKELDRNESPSFATLLLNNEYVLNEINNSTKCGLSPSPTQSPSLPKESQSFPLTELHLTLCERLTPKIMCDLGCTQHGSSCTFNAGNTFVRMKTADMLAFGRIQIELLLAHLILKDEPLLNDCAIVTPSSSPFVHCKLRSYSGLQLIGPAPVVDSNGYFYSLQNPEVSQQFYEHPAPILFMKPLNSNPLTTSNHVTLWNLHDFGAFCTLLREAYPTLDLETMLQQCYPKCPGRQVNIDQVSNICRTIFSELKENSPYPIKRHASEQIYQI
ncbi:hypothetical protein CRM22_010529 [Opisthorchis felineus]|uniref:Protein kinase domain-containing protein n=1 Tax=Opisthorchis felineus TaxID=147828 RepID=A0A4S2KYW7_OPIFE|nr:hypothetical protein CRM22_010529 [Opisthorchis felineus]